MPPDRCRAVGYRIEQGFAVGGLCGLLQLLGQIEIIPADDTVLDEPFARFLQLLVFFLRLEKLSRVADLDSPREAVHVFDPVQLLFDRLSQHGIVDDLENNQ